MPLLDCATKPGQGDMGVLSASRDFVFDYGQGSRFVAESVVGWEYAGDVHEESGGRTRMRGMDTLDEGIGLIAWSPGPNI